MTLTYENKRLVEGMKKELEKRDPGKWKEKIKMQREFKGLDMYACCHWRKEHK